MSKFDIILAIPLLWGAFIGFKKGFILELSSLVALVLGIYGSLKFSDFTATQLNKYFEFETEYLGLISFLVTFILIVIGVFLLGKVLDKALKLIALGLVNRIMGLLFGLLKYALILSFLLYFFEYINRKYGFIEKNYAAGSHLYQPLKILHKPFEKLLTDFEPKEIQEQVNDLKNEF